MPKRKKQKTLSSSSLQGEKTPNGPLFRATTANKETSSQQPRILDSHPNNLLADLLAPALTPAEFLTKHFRKQAVYIPTAQGANRVAKISQYMLNLDVREIFDQTASENIFVWLKPQEQQDNDNTTLRENGSRQKKINSIEVPEPEMAYALYQAGHPTYCRAPPHVEQVLLGALLENTGLGCGQYDASGQSMTSLGRAEVETFISTQTGSITGFHTDFQENFTIQLSGRKRWTLQRGNVAHVLRGVTPHYAVSAVEGQIKAGRLDQVDFAFGPPTVGKNAVGPTDEVILEPGDVLYFPAGMWHKIEVLEPGISINCSLMATNYATLVCQSLQHLLLQRPEWRASVCRPPDGATTITDSIDKLLHGLPQIIKDWTNQQGAAQGVIPPVLQHGEILSPDDDKGDEHLWEEMEEVSSGDQEGNGDGGDEKEGVTSSSTSASSSIDSDEEDGDPIVNLDDEPPENAEFDPSQSTIQKKHKTHKLARNPLALLIDEKDVVRYYQTNRKESKNDHIYILNVNYAGNEAHESFLRLRIQSTEGKLDRMSPNDLEEKYLEKKPFVIAWFLYLGYLVWVPRKSS